MPLWRATPRRIVVAWFAAGVLALSLSACSAQLQTPPTGTTSARMEGQSGNRCSVLAMMACKAMSLLSFDSAGNSEATCFASRDGGGTVVETCGSAIVKPQITVEENPKANTHSVVLAWSDNSDNEINFVIERCDEVNLKGDGPNQTAVCAGAWKAIGSVEANSTSYIDKTALFNHTYIYRVKAANSVGSSAYTGEMSITTPER